MLSSINNEANKTSASTVTNSDTEYKPSRPVGINAEVSFNVDRSLIETSTDHTFAFNGSADKNWRTQDHRWEWIMLGELFDDAPDFTIVFHTCGSRKCRAVPSRMLFEDVGRFEREDAKYVYADEDRMIELTHSTVFTRDFLYVEADIAKWCKTFRSDVKTETFRFYGWYCDESGEENNGDVLRCLLESMTYIDRKKFPDDRTKCKRDLAIDYSAI